MVTLSYLIKIRSRIAVIHVFINEPQPVFSAVLGKHLSLRRDLSRGLFTKKHDFIKKIQIHIIQTALRE